MGLNVSTTMGFENREQLRDTAKNILKSSGASGETSSKIIEETIFSNTKSYTDIYPNSQLAILKASTQISMNGSLKETLKYLKEHANRVPTKRPILGELWENFSENNQSSEENPYTGELVDFQIDKNLKNIFAA